MRVFRAEPITSAANPRVRAAAELRGRAGRAAARRLLVDGWRETARALDGGRRVEVAFVDAASVPAILPSPPPSTAEPDSSAVLRRLAAAGTDIVPVAGPALARLAYGDRASGIVAVVDMPSTDLEPVSRAVAAAAAPLVLVVEDAEKPGNLGAIARSVDGAGATALVAATGRGPEADPWNPNAVRASLGTVFTLPLAVAPTSEVLAWLHRAGLLVVAARVGASMPYADVDLAGPVAIAVGSEAHGLGPEWSGPRVIGVGLPMLGAADSLNVSAAAAVLLYEARRQRDAAAPRSP